MQWQDTALLMAGVLGSCVAVIHGILTQRLMVKPLEALFVADERITAPIRRLIPLLEFGREREGIDLSKVKLTHHSLKDQGKRQLPLEDGDAPKLPPLSEAGSGSLHEKEKAHLSTRSFIP